MEAKYIALSQLCNNLFPILDLVSEFSKILHLSPDKAGQMHIKIDNDNIGAITLAGLEPCRMTPCSKHYTIKDHWFCDHITKQKIKLVKIFTSEPNGRPLHQRTTAQNLFTFASL